MLDYAGPARFEPTDRARGVGVHPHKGFETVTIVYHGEVEHRDSTGAGGVIGPGDVQWMTAASGILHEEYHSPAFARRREATLEMVQLWVNLLAKDKLAKPGYQTLLNAGHPTVALPKAQENSVSLRAALMEHKGPRIRSRRSTSGIYGSAKTSPATLDLPEGHTLSVLVLSRYGRSERAGDRP